MDFVFHAHNASAKATICRLMECPMHCHGILHMIVSNQRGSEAMAHAHEIHGPSHVLEASALLRKWNGLFEEAVMALGTLQFFAGLR